MSNKGWHNAQLRKKHLPTIKEFCESLGFEYHFVNDYEWHIRIENTLDVFPTHKRWHWLPDGARGSYKDYEDLGNIFAERLEDTDNDEE